MFFMINTALPLEGMNPLLSFLTFNDVTMPVLRDHRMLRIRKPSTDKPKVGSASKTASRPVSRFVSEYFNRIIRHRTVTCGTISHESSIFFMVRICSLKEGLKIAENSNEGGSAIMH